ncbi:hypothetical protein AAT19DRAFT_10070 [Rhodotorula toruloides]|uniref:Uncharacterized protein n=1 Tax=Rhodotorula toruloides TaxID=5286 RepID=A0A2T0A1T5_RHOTO|nr:hypothetical protein AAT19DRAFT_10070 [Rhodotorula toruloides]
MHIAGQRFARGVLGFQRLSLVLPPIASVNCADPELFRMVLSTAEWRSGRCGEHPLDGSLPTDIIAAEISQLSPRRINGHIACPFPALRSLSKLLLDHRSDTGSAHRPPP